MVTPRHAADFPSRARRRKEEVDSVKSARVLVSILAAVIVISTAALAWSRVGLLDLPSIPRNVTAANAGLDKLNWMRELDDFIWHRSWPNMEKQIVVDFGVPFSGDPELDKQTQAAWARHGIRADIRNIKAGETERSLDDFRAAICSPDPDNLVFHNAYRMEVFRLRRDFLNEARKRGEITPQFPEYLDKQPIKFFEELVREYPSRETKLSLALAWVDNMLLFPALEIKAPSSVQSVDILTEILNEPGNEYYVPALFARGLNHLHRPARLVWPESAKTPTDAAAQDIAKCVAIGRKLGVGSKHLQATLAMTLGDAYVKAGRFSLARSWWQIAQNMCHDNDIEQAILRRYAWRDEEMIDRLEEELDRSRSELEHPMTDLALMWN